MRTDSREEEGEERGRRRGRREGGEEGGEREMVMGEAFVRVKLRGEEGRRP